MMSTRLRLRLCLVALWSATVACFVWMRWLVWTASRQRIGENQEPFPSKGITLFMTRENIVLFWILLVTFVVLLAIMGFVVLALRRIRLQTRNEGHH
jgi:hypothetical protein